MKETTGIKTTISSLKKALKTIEDADNNVTEKEKKKLDKQIAQLDNYTQIIYREKSSLIRK